MATSTSPPTIAHVIPITRDALLATAGRPNRLIVSSSTAEKRIGIKVDYTILLGRRCLTFGHSRKSFFVLPDEHDVAAKQFALRFDPETLRLSVVADSKGHTLKLALGECIYEAQYGIPHEIHTTTFVFFGDNDRFGFSINPVPTTPGSACVIHRQRYAVSIGLP